MLYKDIYWHTHYDKVIFQSIVLLKANIYNENKREKNKQKLKYIYIIYILIKVT